MREFSQHRHRSIRDRIGFFSSCVVPMKSASQQCLSERYFTCMIQISELTRDRLPLSLETKEIPSVPSAGQSRPNWPDCKAIPAYGLMMSVCLSVRPSVRLSVRLSTFWLTSVFKFILGHINQYRLDTLHGNRPWWDLLNCDLSLWPWPSLFLFKVT